LRVLIGVEVIVNQLSTTSCSSARWTHPRAYG